MIVTSALLEIESEREIEGTQRAREMVLSALSEIKDQV